MSIASKKLITDGLVFYYDTSVSKSYTGEPTTNILPTPSLNALPTYGNGWGTYNTNQYNNAQYFSIGTISSVASNIITTSGNHPLRTYDVVQPQTTGGGLTAGQVYLIKKLSNTTFTIHDYNSSQDGSQGYINPSTGNHKVWDSLANDTRVSVNSTNFPTMWWGPPHYPNSGLVKEIIPNGFDAIPGQVTDCIRLNYSRPDGVADGMSYNVDCTVTPGVPYTVSFWSRSADINAIGKQIQYQNYNYTGGSAAGFYGYFNLGPLGVWQKQSFTFTYTYGTVISYWFSVPTGPYRWDLANIQVEQKNHSTPLTLGTRSNTQALLDLTNTYSINLSSAGFDNDANITFNGSSNYINANSVPDSFWNAGSWTASVWVKFSTVNKGSDNAIFGHGVASGNNGLHLAERTSKVYFGFYGNDLTGNTTLAVNTWYNIVWVFNYSTKLKQIYVNGNFDASGGTVGYGGTGSNTEFGRYPWSTGNLLQGSLPVVNLYNRVLNSSEILQNYNTTKGRFGLT